MQISAVLTNNIPQLPYCWLWREPEGHVNCPVLCGRAEGEVRDAACFSCDIRGSRAVIMHACPGAAVGPTCHQSSSAFVWDGGLSVFILAVQDLCITPANGVAPQSVPWSQWLGLSRVAVVPPSIAVFRVRSRT